MEQIPLVVDLDGTLLRSDLLVESGLAFIRDSPQRLPSLLLWLLRGKATLKHELAHAIEIDASVLPYDRGVIELIRAERERGRTIVLATASNRRLAECVAAYLGLFDLVLASDERHNLSARAKRHLLVQTYGDQGFDYAGNSRADLAVWDASRHAYVVNAPAGVERRARDMGRVGGVLRSERPGLRDLRHALRLHQWLKNLLVFVPLLAAHRYSEPPLLLAALVAFLCFGLCASSVYILNDLLDLRDDRHHPVKRSRPFAAGRISIVAGLVACPALLFGSFGLALWKLPPAFVGGLFCYWLLALTYSLGLKRYMVIDVITLAGLYTLRVIGGAAALGIPLSFWLLAFSLFMFFSLALVKRYAELLQVRLDSGQGKARGRGYYSEDLPMIASLGSAAGYIAVLVLALYINDERNAQYYGHVEFIWLACPLLLTWISRVWMLSHRGQMHDDPVVFALRDPASLATGALMALVFWFAI